MSTLKLAPRALNLNLFRKFLSLVIAPSLALSSCGQRLKPDFSSTDSVDIAQTPIKNQQAIGFCWAYATMALIESNHKMRTGDDIDLSEEALGYVRMRHELMQVANNFRAGSIQKDDIKKWLEDKSLEGWFVRNSDASPTVDAMELIDKYGVVPEKVWNVKFKARIDVSQLKSAMANSFLDFLETSETVSEKALDAVMTVDGAFHEAPPKSFTFHDKRYTAQSFAREYLQFKSQDYVLLQAKSAADSRTMIIAMKRAMAAGYSIPISFGVSMQNLKSGFFSAKDVDVNQLDTNPEVIPDIISLNGNHAVIAVDFVNRGSEEGAIAPDMLRREVEKSADQLAYIKLKNSWGAHTSTTENGLDVTSSSDGYYRMDYAYIKAISAKGKFGIVVPRQFAR